MIILPRHFCVQTFSFKLARQFKQFLSLFAKLSLNLLCHRSNLPVLGGYYASFAHSNSSQETNGQLTPIGRQACFQHDYGCFTDSYRYLNWILVAAASSGEISLISLMSYRHLTVKPELDSMDQMSLHQDAVNPFLAHYLFFHDCP